MTYFYKIQNVLIFTNYRYFVCVWLSTLQNLNFAKLSYSKETKWRSFLLHRIIRHFTFIVIIFKFHLKNVWTRKNRHWLLHVAFYNIVVRTWDELVMCLRKSSVRPWDELVTCLRNSSYIQFNCIVNNSGQTFHLIFFFYKKCYSFVFKVSIISPLVNQVLLVFF